MKKFIAILVIFAFSTYNALGVFEIDTSLSKTNQKIIIDKLDKIWGDFDTNLSIIPLETRAISLETIIDNIDKMLLKEKKETNRFIISYLRYLAFEDLVKLNEELKNNKDTEIETIKDEELKEDNAIVGDLVPDNELNQTLFLSGTKDNKIMAFKIRADYDNIRLKKLVFSGVGLENLQNFRLLTPTGEQISATSTTNNEKVFSNINGISNYVIPKNTTAYYNIIADINSGVNSKTFSLTLDTSNSILLSSLGRDISLSGGNVSTKIMTIVNTAVFVSKVENDSKNLFTEALKFSVTAFGNNGATLAGATFRNSFSGYDTTNASLKVYKNSIANRNLLGSTALGDVTGDIVFTQNNIIEPANTNTYVVVVDGAVFALGAVNQFWVISMTDLVIDTGIHLGDYANTGEFPITETK